MRLCPIQEKLVPELENLPKAQITQALRPISEAYIATHLLPNARFHARIRAQVLEVNGVQIDRPIPPFRDDHLIRAILDDPLDQIVLSLGLSWNSNLLCQYALRPEGRLAVLLEGVAQEEVQFALRLRSHAPQSDPSAEKDQAEMSRDGLACLLAGLQKTPRELRDLVTYCLSLQGLEQASALPTAQMAADFFHAWCAQRFDKLSSDMRDAA